MAVAVTGASGYIGRRVVARLQGEGTSVVALSRAGETGRFRDLLDGREGTLAELMVGTQALVHLAGRLVDDVAAPVEAYLEPNVVLTDRALAAAVEDHVEVVVHASSRLVYPSDLTTPAVEDRDARPDTAYGLSKLWAEDVVRFRTAGTGTSALSLRVAQVTGGDHPGLGVINTFIRQARETGRLTVRGSGAAVREVVHVDDVVEAVISALQHRGPWTPVNVGGVGPMTVAEIAGQVAESAGLGPEAVRHVPVDHDDLSVYALDPTHRREVLPWEPKWSMPDIITEAMQQKEESR
ncbi:NAD(P)-dependent oxidoreductase [Nostocoides sp. F2B08]|uniref:NAD-dependent epimerase/dehydratase family protein n=1 Tax=Nostocoides sp. F2B08 TaxID=2653936 RepID=UPI00186B3CF8|nr:NAD(P)-dependent oxidoreductase [Tetrasphaera sp. F2B08]